MEFMELVKLFPLVIYCQSLTADKTIDSEQKDTQLSVLNRRALSRA